MEDKITFKDYFGILCFIFKLVGLITLSIGPLCVGLALTLVFTPWFLLIWLVYIPILPIIIILWSMFWHECEE